MNYRILSLDGGGVRGLLTIVLLERLEAAAPGWLADTDLLAGTSTGGVITLGLAAGLQPQDLRHLYYHHMPKVFADHLLDDIRDIGNLLGAEYSLSYFSNVLQKYLGDLTLNQLNKRVLVSAFDLDNQHPDPAQRTWKPKFFHNFPGEDSDGDLQAYKVAIYSSAAPTYFPSDDGFIDGGVVAPNPAVAALAQTQDPRATFENRPTLNQVTLLSLGTGSQRKFISGEKHDWGYLQWAKPMIDLVFQGMNGVADYQCRQFLGDGYHRLGPNLPVDMDISMDDWQKRDELIRFGEQIPLERTLLWLEHYWA